MHRHPDDLGLSDCSFRSHFGSSFQGSPVDRLIDLLLLGMGRNKDAKRSRAEKGDERDDCKRPRKERKCDRESSVSCDERAKRPSRSELQHCSVCSVTNQDKDSEVPFARELGLPDAEKNQCKPCYTVWLPSSRFISWQQWCDDYEKDPTFRKQVNSAREGVIRPSTLRPLPMADEIASHSRIEVKVSKKGTFKRLRGKDENQLQIGGTHASIKQLQLPEEDAITLPVGDGQSLKGYLFATEEDYDVEVAVVSDLSHSNVALARGSTLVPAVAKKVLQHAFDKGRASSTTGLAAHSQVTGLLFGKGRNISSIDPKAGLILGSAAGDPEDNSFWATQGFKAPPPHPTLVGPMGAGHRDCI